jgi:hypothetical protein
MKSVIVSIFVFLLVVVSIPACAATTNLLNNSSFEICTNEKIPDFWGPGGMGLSVPEYVLNPDSWRKRWGIDETTSHSGKRSLRIDCNGDASNLSLHAKWVDVPKLNVPYTLSVWLKADRENMPVSFGFEGVQDQTIGTTWKRYWVTCNAYDALLTILLIPKAKGVIWVDDFQFEEGSQPSDWTPAPGDASLTGDAVHRIVPDVKPFKVRPGKKTLAVVKIDSNRRFLVDGVPFIPFSSGWEHTPTREIIQDTAKAGFNAITIWVGNDKKLEEVKKCFDDANSFGLKVIVGMSGGITDENRTMFMTSLKDHPALIAWNVCDEPQRDDPTPAKAYELAKKIDPAHPAYVNYAPGFYLPDKLLSDIASLDQYTIGCGYTPLDQAKNVDMLEKIAKPGGGPSWIWLQSSGNAYWIPREPTGPEEEAMVYLCLIHGVRGIKFWIDIPLNSELHKTMKMLTRELRHLTPIIYSIDTPPAVSVSPSSIHMIGKMYKGRKYVIAANTLPTKTTAEIKVPTTRSEATVLFENRKVKVESGVIKDSFEGYQRHVYEVR